MKKIIFLMILFLSVVSYSQTSKEYTFSAGDTAVTFGVNKANVVYFTLKDSAMTGTDSIYIAITHIMSNGLIMNSIISLHDLAQTTTTTFVGSNIVIPGDAGTKTYVWYPGGVSGTEATFTGTFRITRLNGVNATTPYTPNTRMFFRYE